MEEHGGHEVTDVGTTKRKSMTKGGSSPVDIAGERFGKWVAISLHPVRKNKRTLWLCRCDCGTEKAVLTCHLVSGRSKACLSCKPKGEASPRFKHGSTKHPLYYSWRNMLDRCRNPNNEDWHLYGGKGVTVCAAWAKDFLKFVEDMGPKPTSPHSIDRIDSNGNYEPQNCRWATAKQQARNMSRNRHVEHRGDTVTLAEACERTGVNYGAARWRLNNGHAWGGL